MPFLCALTSGELIRYFAQCYDVNILKLGTFRLLALNWHTATVSPCLWSLQERFSYVCPDLVKEFNKYDSDGTKWIKQYTGINAITKKEFTIDVGYERFLGPEIFFHPEVSMLCATCQISVLFLLATFCLFSFCFLSTSSLLSSYLVSAFLFTPCPSFVCVPPLDFFLFNSFTQKFFLSLFMSTSCLLTSALPLHFCLYLVHYVFVCCPVPVHFLCASCRLTPPLSPLQVCQPRLHPANLRSCGWGHSELPHWRPAPTVQGKVTSLQPSPFPSCLVSRCFTDFTLAYCLQNIVLSGGSTMFRDFGRRLQRDLKRTVDSRLKISEELSGGKLKVRQELGQSPGAETKYSLVVTVHSDLHVVLPCSPSP